MEAKDNILNNQWINKSNSKKILKNISEGNENDHI